MLWLPKSFKFQCKPSWEESTESMKATDALLFSKEVGFKTIVIFSPHRFVFFPVSLLRCHNRDMAGWAN